MATLPVDGPTLVLDAGAIACLEPGTDILRRLNGRVIMTPNSDELAMVAGEDADKVEADRRGFASRVAEDLGKGRDQMFDGAKLPDGLPLVIQIEG